MFKANENGAGKQRFMGRSVKNRPVSSVPHAVGKNGRNRPEEGSRDGSSSGETRVNQKFDPLLHDSQPFSVTMDRRTFQLASDTDMQSAVYSNQITG